MALLLGHYNQEKLEEERGLSRLTVYMRAMQGRNAGQEAGDRAKAEAMGG